MKNTIEIRPVPSNQRIDPAKNQVDVIVFTTTITEVSRKSYDGPEAMKNAEAEAKRAVDAGEAVLAEDAEAADAKESKAKAKEHKDSAHK